MATEKGKQLSMNYYMNELHMNYTQVQRRTKLIKAARKLGGKQKVQQLQNK